MLHIYVLLVFIFTVDWGSLSVPPGKHLYHEQHRSPIVKWVAIVTGNYRKKDIIFYSRHQGPYKSGAELASDW